jgi:hypothetical protein
MFNVHPLYQFFADISQSDWERGKTSKKSWASSRCSVRHNNAYSVRNASSEISFEAQSLSIHFKIRFLPPRKAHSGSVIKISQLMFRETIALFVKLRVLTATTMKTTVFLHTAPCTPVQIDLTEALRIGLMMKTFQKTVTFSCCLLRETNKCLKCTIRTNYRGMKCFN